MGIFTLLILYICLYIAGEVPRGSYGLLKDSDVLPIAGSLPEWPAAFPNPKAESWAGDSRAFNGSTDTSYLHYLLDDLLNLGADRPADTDSVQIIPVLDGNQPPHASDKYAMKFVLFDVKLVSLDLVDPLGSSFKAHWQIILSWEAWMGAGRNESWNVTDCKFTCDNTNNGLYCCDRVWVPRLQIPGCTFDTMESVVEWPLSFVYSTDSYAQRLDHNQTVNEFCYSSTGGDCYWRRFWKLNIISTCGATMTFENFPFDRQQLNIEIVNTYSSSTWLQLVKGSFAGNAGDITNEASPLERKIPGWYIEDVKVSVRSGAYSWRRTLSTLNMVLQNVSATPDKYMDQETKISEAMSKLDFLHGYENLEHPVHSSLYDMNDLGIYDAMVGNYTERLVATLNHYRKCVNEYGIDYTRGNDSVFTNPRQNETLSSLWLNVTSEQKTRVSLTCLIEAAAELTTPRLRIAIHIRRYRVYYGLKLLLPMIACGAFAFAVIGIPPNEVADRLMVVIPSALALAALQIVVVAADVPAVTYFVSTTYIIVATYFALVAVVLESIIVGLCGSERANKKQVEGNDAAGRPILPSVDKLPISNGETSLLLQNAHSKGNSNQNLEVELTPTSPHPGPSTSGSIEVNNAKGDYQSITDDGEESNMYCCGMFVQRKYKPLFKGERPKLQRNRIIVDNVLLVTLGSIYATIVCILLLRPYLKSNHAHESEGISIFNE